MNLIRIFSIIIALFLTQSSFAEINASSWSKECSQDNEKNCIIAIKHEVKLKDQNKNQTLATAYVRIVTSKQKEMNLIDEKDQTYKLSEKNKAVPVLIVNLPLNTDLRRNPLIVSDKKSIGNMIYTHCNKDIGCETILRINEDVIKSFKKGKTMSIIYGVHGNSQKNISTSFPLKGFSKAYDQLVKG